MHVHGAPAVVFIDALSQGGSREWFYFDQEQKPLYPLFIEACDRHSRMFAYNYVDMRSDRRVALNSLLANLGRDYDPPEPVTAAEKVAVFENIEAEPRSLPEALQAVYDAVCEPEGSVVLSTVQAIAIRDHKAG